MSCRFCDDNHRPLEDRQRRNIRIERITGLWVLTVRERSGDARDWTITSLIPVDYCPICGRDLSEVD